MGTLLTFRAPERPAIDLEPARDEAAEIAARVAAAAAARAQDAADIERGRALLADARPAWAVACIVAELEVDQCDYQSDYFATKTTRTLFLGWSKTKRDNFAEMRKAAALAPETAHLGPGRDLYTARVRIAASFKAAGSYYHQGDRSHWHGDPETFTTRAEAEHYIEAQGPAHPIEFDGVAVPFEWHITTESVEHREKYSMGRGYYLKAACRYSSGWTVSKKNWNLDALAKTFARHPEDARA